MGESQSKPKINIKVTNRKVKQCIKMSCKNYDNIIKIYNEGYHKKKKLDGVKHINLYNEEYQQIIDIVKKYNINKELNDIIYDNFDECCVCMDDDEKPTEVFACGHKCVCDDCYDRLEICPVCREGKPALHNTKYHQYYTIIEDDEVTKLLIPLLYSND
jgi:hypothetical protein